MAKNSNYEKMVLDDSLFLEYHKYKNNEEYDKNTILKLFQYFNGNILTNLAQYKRMGLSPVDNIKSQMVHAANKNQELTSLAKETSIKYILSKDKSIFPYVNVDSDQEKIKNCVGGFFEIQENRDKAVEHIKALCSTAQKIAIYDKYFCNGNDNVALLASILPHHALEIVCYGNEQNVACDNVVIAAGFVPDNSIYTKLEEETDMQVFNVGDAKRVRQIFDAVHEGYIAAKLIH